MLASPLISAFLCWQQWPCLYNSTEQALFLPLSSRVMPFLKLTSHLPFCLLWVKLSIQQEVVDPPTYCSKQGFGLLLGHKWHQGSNWPLGVEADSSLASFFNLLSIWGPPEGESQPRALPAAEDSCREPFFKGEGPLGTVQ